MHARMYERTNEHIYSTQRQGSNHGVSRVGRNATVMHNPLQTWVLDEHGALRKNAFIVKVETGSSRPALSDNDP